MNFHSFETERLLLKPTSVDDANLVFELFNTPKWIQYIGDREVTTLSKAKDYIREKMRPQLERLGFSNYTLIRKSDGTKLGTCGLFDREGLEGIDLGFALLPDFEGNGYAYEASDRMKKAAFNEFGLESLLAITAEDNQASQRLLEKLGFLKMDAIQLPGDMTHLLRYRLKNESHG